MKESLINKWLRLAIYGGATILFVGAGLTSNSYYLNCGAILIVGCLLSDILYILKDMKRIVGELSLFCFVRNRKELEDFFAGDTDKAVKDILNIREPSRRGTRANSSKVKQSTTKTENNAPRRGRPKKNK